MSARHPVPFEHAGLLPVALLLLFGASSTLAAASSLDDKPAAQTAAVAPPAPPPPVTAPVPVPPAPSSAAPEAKSAAPEAKSAEPAKVDGPCAPKVSVTFTAGEPNPPVNAAQKLAPFAKFLVDHPDVTLAVNGHADATGSDDSNVALSHRRAKGVAKLLEAAGVAKSRMTVRGFGAFQPLEGKDEAAPDNRRVILRVRGIPTCDQVPEEVIAP